MVHTSLFPLDIFLFVFVTIVILCVFSWQETLLVKLLLVLCGLHLERVELEQLGLEGGHRRLVPVARVVGYLALPELRVDVGECAVRWYERLLGSLAAEARSRVAKVLAEIDVDVPGHQLARRRELMVDHLELVASLGGGLLISREDLQGLILGVPEMGGLEIGVRAEGQRNNFSHF